MNYPILMTRLQDPYNPTGDVFRGSYRQGVSVAEDRLDQFQPVSTYPTANEGLPGFMPDGAPMLMMDDRLIEKRPNELGTVWTRDDVDDFEATQEGVYYTSDGVLFKLVKPGGRAQRIEVAAPLAGGIEASPKGLVLQTDRGLLEFDPQTGTGAEIAFGAFDDFSLSHDARQVVYSAEGAIRVRDLESGEDRLLLAASGEYRSGPRFSPDANRVFFTGWHIGMDLAIRSRLQVIEPRCGAIPRTLVEQVIEARPGAGEAA